MVALLISAYCSDYYSDPKYALATHVRIDVVHHSRLPSTSDRRLPFAHGLINMCLQGVGSTVFDAWMFKSFITL